MDSVYQHNLEISKLKELIGICKMEGISQFEGLGFSFTFSNLKSAVPTERQMKKKEKKKKPNFNDINSWEKD